MNQVRSIEAHEMLCEGSDTRIQLYVEGLDSGGSTSMYVCRRLAMIIWHLGCPDNWASVHLFCSSHCEEPPPLRPARRFVLQHLHGGADLDLGSAGSMVMKILTAFSLSFGFQDGFGLVHTTLVVVSACFRMIVSGRFKVGG